MKRFLITLTLSIFSASVFASSKYSITNINLGYGKLDMSSGNGDLLAQVDAKNNLEKISIDVDAGMLGVNQNIKQSLSLKELTSGKTMMFYMDGAIEPIMKITSMAGFNSQGGKVKISVRKYDGFHYQIVELAKNKSEQFRIWKEDNRINEIAINVRGYNFANMYVGWYELVTK
jgi:hypothetical protein